ncbi:MAG: alkaline phosphatase [Deltaproteobacteria bacterium]|nr:alkaline phosphatase [Deltaproteobacteria bacterium]
MLSKRLLLQLLLVGILFMAPLYAEQSAGVKNIILMIGDGMGIPHLTLSRWVKGAPLAMDPWICGLVRTYNSDTPIADSAPAATAMATGFKSVPGRIAVRPEKVLMPGLEGKQAADPRNTPLVTILEAARLAGKATGIVATSEIEHATPAAFSAHCISRKDYEIIAEQQVYNGLDLAFGGGLKYLKRGERKDGDDLLRELDKLGYEILQDRAALLAADRLPVFGLFAELDLAFDIDRPDTQPSLAEMTAKAVDLLKADPDGFFLMVEGSKIDWAAHANDPAGLTGDILAFDKAIQAALDFAQKNGETAVIVTADHSTGGLSIGDASTHHSYESTGLETFLEPIRKARRSVEGVEKEILAAGDVDPGSIRSQVKQWMGMELTRDERLSLEDYFRKRKTGSKSYNNLLGPILSRRARLGWTTHGHTGGDVVLAVYHPKNDRPTGLIENTSINEYMQKVLGLDLASLNRTLYLPVDELFAATGVEASIDLSSPENPVLRVKKNGHTLRLAANRNIADIDGKMVRLKTLTVFNGKEFFIPKEAANLIVSIAKESGR